MLNDEPILWDSMNGAWMLSLDLTREQQEQIMFSLIKYSYAGPPIAFAVQEPFEQEIVIATRDARGKQPLGYKANIRPAT